MKHAAYQLNFVDYILHQDGHKQEEFEAEAGVEMQRKKLLALKRNTARNRLKRCIKMLENVKRRKNSERLAEYRERKRSRA